MSVRILHCGESIENYNICINERVAGFSNKGPEKGDLIYLTVKTGNKILCGARFTLAEKSDLKPWVDRSNFIYNFTIKDIDFCQPFDIAIISEVRGPLGILRFIKGAQALKERSSITLLDSQFVNNRIFEFETFGLKPQVSYATENTNVSTLRFGENDAFENIPVKETQTEKEPEKLEEIVFESFFGEDKAAEAYVSPTRSVEVKVETEQHKELEEVFFDLNAKPVEVFETPKEEKVLPKQEIEYLEPSYSIIDKIKREEARIEPTYENQSSNQKTQDIEAGKRGFFDFSKAEQPSFDPRTNSRIKMIGTFQTIQFVNETDTDLGLQPLVNDFFYSLFPKYRESKTILIPQNKIFKIDEGNRDAAGSYIPDAILLHFANNGPNPFEINLIEYACFGESLVTVNEKVNHLNGNIIPKLMRMSSTFSVNNTEIIARETVVREWTERIIDYININPDTERKAAGWIKELKPEIKERSIDIEIQKNLEDAFKKNLKVKLIIDELSSEQKDTVRNVIKPFRLDTGESIQFDGYVVHLVQKINFGSTTPEFALTVQ